MFGMAQPVFLRIRPAFLGAALAAACGASRRRFVSTANGTFFVNPVSLAGSKIASSEFEPTMRSVLETYLKEGGVFIDLGANEGYFSVIASRLVGIAGSVIAIEPQSRLHGVIQANLSANQCSNVRVFRCAISDRNGEARLSLAPGLITGSSSLFGGRGKSELVESYRLEEFLERAQVSSCDLMKVDIESAEYEVFMSSSDLLRSGRIRNIALEIHNSLLKERGLSGQMLHEHILACGYNLNDSLGNWVYTFDR